MPNKLGSAYSIGLTSLRARQLDMETATDNLANLNTPGFKERRVSFQTYLGNEDGELVRAGVPATETTPNLMQGPTQNTFQAWDLAIDGEGYFALQLPSGEIGYSRLGRFHLDSDRRLATEHGYLLAPTVTIPEGAEYASIDAQGIITTVQNGLPQVIGNLELTRFANSEGLQHIGDGIHRPTEASGGPITAAPAENGLGQVLGGALEMSNVDAARQMINIMNVQKAYGLALRALQITDQMTEINNQLQG